MKRAMKHYIYVIGIILIGASSLSGCCSIKNIPDYIAGTYVKQPEEGTPGRYIETFDYSYPICFEKALGTLKELGVAVRYKSVKKRTILAWYFDGIYDRTIDTTKVGIYFKKITPEKTQVDVACGNYGLAKFASEKIFQGLQKK